MLRLACDKNSLSGTVYLCQGDAVNMPLKPNSFNWVHMESILHHLVGESRMQSKELVLETLQGIKKILKPGGFLLLEELFYESFLSPTLTPEIVFKLLSFSDKHGFNMWSERGPSFLKRNVKGLIVSFYTRGELYEMLESINADVLTYKTTVRPRRLFKNFMLLKNHGSIKFLIQFPN